MLQRCPAATHLSLEGEVPVVLLLLLLPLVPAALPQEPQRVQHTRHTHPHKHKEAWGETRGEEIKQKLSDEHNYSMYNVQCTM